MRTRPRRLVAGVVIVGAVAWALGRCGVSEDPGEPAPAAKPPAAITER